MAKARPGAVGGLTRRPDVVHAPHRLMLVARHRLARPPVRSSLFDHRYWRTGLGAQGGWPSKVAVVRSRRLRRALQRPTGAWLEPASQFPVLLAAAAAAVAAAAVAAVAAAAVAATVAAALQETLAWMMPRAACGAPVSAGRFLR